MNLPTPTKKSSVSQTAKPKSTKKGDDSSETCSDIIPYKGGLLPIGNIFLESSPPLLLVPVLTGVLLQADLIVLHQSHLWMLFLHLYQPRLPLPRGEYVISKLCFFFTLVIY